MLEEHNAWECLFSYMWEQLLLLNHYLYEVSIKRLSISHIRLEISIRTLVELFSLCYNLSTTLIVTKPNEICLTTYIYTLLRRTHDFLKNIKNANMYIYRESERFFRFFRLNTYLYIMLAEYIYIYIYIYIYWHINI